MDRIFQKQNTTHAGYNASEDYLYLEKEESRRVVGGGGKGKRSTRTLEYRRSVSRYYNSLLY